jgi:hypothetical protein
MFLHSVRKNFNGNKGMNFITRLNFKRGYSKSDTKFIKFVSSVKLK